MVQMMVVLMAFHLALGMADWKVCKLGFRRAASLVLTQAEKLVLSWVEWMVDKSVLCLADDLADLLAQMWASKKADVKVSSLAASLVVEKALKTDGLLVA